MRRAARVDANQPEIVQTLRKLGYKVQHLHTVGQGFPDLLASRNGVNYLIEIKDGSKPPSAQKLTPDEEKWHSEWLAPVYIINSVESILEFHKDRA